MAAVARRFRTGLAATCLIACAICLASQSNAAEDPLFVSKRITPEGEYTSGIEGPAVDASGNLYVVNFQQSGNIGKLAAGAAQSQLFTSLPAGSIGNGIRFDRQGRMYVADFKKHNVWVIERGETTPRVYFHSDRFNQPNDLAIAADGTLYASDPRFASPAGGQIWRITRGADGKGQGEVMSSTRRLGVTNGIDLSPDGATLYVSESNSRQVWAYRLDGSKLLDPRLVRGFADFEVDGLRTDVDGRIYLARLSAGKIAVIAADGSLEREVPLSGKQPTNLSFGGPDGRTVFVTQKEGRFIEAFRVNGPGREPCLQMPRMC
ncbi:SMP-30/gluconolactonase/LRE family protein [Bradyrhizobium sp. SRL28]|uniref:SMP-30/gluconolactonase/LRE family protein n=1 Tax=Bradyrhizobium sp. SRL28 TaxID=2836178 RepID=UPI001BDED7D6|nr:SMP-30/gluconolactonase/LRE family protein [Bradyrhizobium sp. SRL28]MBT1512143.1 SMP-30/gluconolactonase/LRE family protein [Bradyrhizobium sp. SRL28]